MASGHVNRANRPNTWLHRPDLQREKVLANSEPSTHGTFPTWRSCLMMSVHRGEAEIICSFRVFRILTQRGPRAHG
jgi:hypothetical protein